MERDTAAVFDELTRDMAEEIAARRRAEAVRRRRALPRSVMTLIVGTLVTTGIGMRNPYLGVLLFVATVAVIERGVRRALPQE